MQDSKRYDSDLVIIGGGNAALCAAITAGEAGLSVTILESAPKAYRGGNSRHTRNFRCMHPLPIDPLVDSYSAQEYLDDLITVTKGKTDIALAQKVIRSSYECLSWMKKQGVCFQASLSGTLSLARTNAFFMGGGKALVNAYYRRAQALGVKVIYGAEVSHLAFGHQTSKGGGHIGYIEYRHQGHLRVFKAKAVIAACGGFQADTDWLARAWGEAAKNFLIRGTPYNRGVVLKNLMDQGISTIGDPTQCHAVAIDGRSPKFDGGIVTRLDCVPFSVVVNKHGARFYDEGEDVWPKRYAIWGRLVATQDEQVAYAIIDSRALHLFMPSVFPPIKADSLEDLADQLAIPSDALCASIAQFNAACPSDDSQFHPTELDGLSTQSLTPPKTNWARRIIEPPFYAYSLKTGVTFTYLGLKVDEQAQVQTSKGKVNNLWAAGEVMAGSILGQGYLAGFGMAIGTVFGRIAGREAANYVNHQHH